MTISYFARVGLSLLSPEEVSFECFDNDIPAQIGITEDTPGVTKVNFPTSFLDRPEPPEPSVTLRRGIEVVPERADRTPIRLRDSDWNVRATGNIGFCVGPATLKVMRGSLNVSANLGQYHANILSTDNVLQDLRIGYDVNASGMELMHFFHADRDGFPPEMSGQIVGSVPHVEGRLLGRLDFDANQLAIGFTSQSTREDVTYPTRLNVRLLLVEAGLASEFPKVTIEAIGDNGG